MIGHAIAGTIIMEAFVYKTLLLVALDNTLQGIAAIHVLASPTMLIIRLKVLVIGHAIAATTRAAIRVSAITTTTTTIITITIVA